MFPSKIDSILTIQAANVVAKWHATQRRMGAAEVSQSSAGQSTAPTME
jgi:hypothetical protein